ncbi:hypothetical protein EB796_018785 [Bugula neritina]|uniref:Uncharacterized protein n=1 Tax=Bugula neritina TaxID=10212 RepID=A0A7J7J9J4_BUGNE|nr:hypothetical protein EB796_018785 [Bugula neritina]
MQYTLLQRVQDLARKDTDEKVHLSGSEFDTGSESSSDNEEFVIEPSGDLPKQSTSDIVAPFTNFGITQSTHTKPVDATQIDIEMSSPDHDSPTRKRKRAA